MDNLVQLVQLHDLNGNWVMVNPAFTAALRPCLAGQPSVLETDLPAIEAVSLPDRTMVVPSNGPPFFVRETVGEILELWPL